MLTVSLKQDYPSFTGRTHRQDLNPKISLCRNKYEKLVVLLYDTPPCREQANTQHGKRDPKSRFIFLVTLSSIKYLIPSCLYNTNLTFENIDTQSTKKWNAGRRELNERTRDKGSKTRQSIDTQCRIHRLTQPRNMTWLSRGCRRPMILLRRSST